MPKTKNTLESSNGQDKATPSIDKLKQTGFTVYKITPQDTDKWLEMGKLRARIYVDERKFLSPDVVNEDGAEYDPYDERSDHYVALGENDAVIGTVRVINKPDGNKLPSEELFGIDLSSEAREISRIMVESSLSRALKPLVSMSLIRAALHATSDRDEDVYAVVELSLARYLQDSIGIQLTDITEPRYVEEYQSVNQVVAMHPRSVLDQIRARDERQRSIYGLPDRLAPFFEQSGMGRVALISANNGAE